MSREGKLVGAAGLFLVGGLCFLPVPPALVLLVAACVGIATAIVDVNHLDKE